MIKTLFSSSEIKYQVIKDGKTTTYEDIDDAIRDEFQIGSAVPEGWFHIHYDIMDDLSDLEFMGGLLPKCKPRFCNGSYAMFEYESSDGVCWIVTTMEGHVMAAFVLREQAMKYIHDKECR